MAPASDRYEPLPGPLGLPGFLWRKLGRAGQVLVVAAAVALVVAGALLIPEARSRSGERAAADSERRAALRAERIAQLVPLVQPKEGRAPADASRRGILARLEADVLADARARATRGEMRGPFRGVRCFGFPKQLDESSPAAGNAPVARLECIAVTSRIAPGGRTTGALLGQPFRARVDFRRSRYAWCRVIQRPGELAVTRTPELKPRAACGG